MDGLKRHFKRAPIAYVTAGSLLVVALALGVSLTLHHRPPAAFPESVVRRAAFSIFYPAAHTVGLKPETTSIQYGTKDGILTYTVLVNSNRVAVSEQATPQVFSQSGVYGYKLGQAHQYASLNTGVGEVDLTRPTGLQNQTVAWANAKGTLVLARALQPLTNAQWLLLFNNMEVLS